LNKWSMSCNSYGNVESLYDLKDTIFKDV
jgi:hypothetical protein